METIAALVIASAGLIVGEVVLCGNFLHGTGEIADGGKVEGLPLRRRLNPKVQSAYPRFELSSGLINRRNPFAWHLILVVAFPCGR